MTSTDSAGSSAPMARSAGEDCVRGRDLWTWGGYPGMVACGLGLAVGLHHLGLPAGLIAGTVTAMGVVVLLLLQRRLGMSKLGPGDLGTDLLHLGLSNGLVTGLMQATLTGGVVALSFRLSTALGAGLWPQAWPLPLQVLLAMVIGELAFTTMHRLAHHLRVLWPIHAVHHSSTTLYVLSAARTHPLNAALSYATQLFPALLLGAHGEVLLYLGVLTSVLGLLQHTDLGLRSGWLSFVLATPEVHRIHHSVDPVQGMHNFGSSLVIWDHVYGTYMAPGERPEAVGIAEVEVPRGYWGHLRAPFRWRRITGERPARA